MDDRTIMYCLAFMVQELHIPCRVYKHTTSIVWYDIVFTYKDTEYWLTYSDAFPLTCKYLNNLLERQHEGQNKRRDNAKNKA